MSVATLDTTLFASSSNSALLRETEIRSRYRESSSLFRRARRVIPGGIHLSGRPLVDSETTPMYFERGLGSRLWDVDGNEYIDFLMAFGTQLLGYAHPTVERAVHEQGKRGQLLSMNHRMHVEFMESILPLFPGAEMGVFFKTGSEATTAALRIARRATGRKRIARCGYHGWHDWCLPTEDFVPSGLGTQILEFSANSPNSLEGLFDQFPNELAATIVAPEMVVPHRAEIFHQLLAITRARGALFIMDEVKTGMRIAPNSVSGRVGIIPDLLTVSKALANGWPIAITLGSRDVMQCAAGMHLSATYHGDTTAMAASRATLEVIRVEGVQARVEQLGQCLIDSLNAIVAELSAPAEAYAEPLPAMPFFRFTHPIVSTNMALTRRFYQEVLARGILLHPRHMWFISHAHTAADIERTLDACRSALLVTLRAVPH